MIAVVRRPDTGEPTGGIHRTYVADDGLGKAPMDKPKMMLGPCDGVVMLMPMGADGSLGFGEGIETSLAAHKLFGVPTWAGLSTSGMRSFVFPPGLKRLAIFADRGKGGEEAARHLLERALANGIQASITYPRSDDDFAEDLRLGLWSDGTAGKEEVIPPPRTLDEIVSAAQALTRPPDPKHLAVLMRAIVLARLGAWERDHVLKIIKAKTGLNLGDLKKGLQETRRDVGAAARSVGPPPPWADKVQTWENGEPKAI